MRSLSNFFRGGDGATRQQARSQREQAKSARQQAQAPPCVCRVAMPEEIHAGLRLVLATGSKLADNQQVLDFLAFSGQRGIDPAALWVAEQRGKLAWAVLPIRGAGRTMLLLAPPTPLHSVIGSAGALIDRLCEHYAAHDVQLAQALLDPSDDAGRRLFESHAFERMAELIYLQAPVRRSAPPPPAPAGALLATYSADTHALFANAILASYQGSLDCPGLNGVRNIEDVIAGHKTSGEFDANHWVVLFEERAASLAPLGVVLVNRVPNTDAGELVYLGLVPEARGRQFGDWMMRQAFASVAAMRLARLTLAVDSANTPALKLYYRFGLSKMGSKIAMMRKLR